jgi:hypothetical protein
MNNLAHTTGSSFGNLSHSAEELSSVYVSNAASSKYFTDALGFHFSSRAASGPDTDEVTRLLGPLSTGRDPGSRDATERVIQAAKGHPFRPQTALM